MVSGGGCAEVVVSDTRRWWMSVMSDLISKKNKDKIIKKTHIVDGGATSRCSSIHPNPIVFTLATNKTFGVEDARVQTLGENTKTLREKVTRTCYGVHGNLQHR